MTPQSRQMGFSIGLHVVALFLALAIGSRTTAPTLAIERPRVTLIAPTIVPTLPPTVTPTPVQRSRTTRPTIELPRTHPPVRDFAAPVPQRITAPSFKQPQIEIAEPLQPVVIAGPAIKAPTIALPPPPIVVGKLGDAASQVSAPAPASAVRVAGFTTTSGMAATTEPSNARIAAAGFASSKADIARTAKQSPVTASGFHGASVADPVPTITNTPRAAPTTKSVEILSKPRPLYSEEARALRLEGEVVLEVLFNANAEARVLRVIRGLGHGLDEAAVASASQIKFRPALQAGEPIDQAAIIRIRFELAY